MTEHLGGLFCLISDQTEKKPVRQVDWNTQRVVDGNEPGSGAMIQRDGKTLVTVSATDDLRDELRNLVRDHLGDEVKYFELDYQPSQK